MVSAESIHCQALGKFTTKTEELREGSLYADIVLNPVWFDKKYKKVRKDGILIDVT